MEFIISMYVIILGGLLKSNVSISVDSDVLKKIRSKPGFNLSGFVENKLRIYLGEEDGNLS